MKTDTTGRKWSCSIACGLLFLAALTRYRVAYDPSETVPRDPEPWRLARSLAEKGQFANPFAALETGPSAHLAPAYPAYLALFIRVLGDGSVGIYAVRLAAAIMISAHLALFPVFSRMLGMGGLNGIIAAIIWVLAKVGTHSPIKNETFALYSWEAFYAAILMAGAACCYRRYVDSPVCGSNRLAVLLGCLMGALILTSPTGNAIFIGWLAWLAWRDRLAIFKGSHLVVILVPTVIVTPWLLRNYLVFDRFILVRDNLGLELAVSNSDRARFGMQDNFASGYFDEVHPNKSMKEAKKVLTYGEARYNELRLREALYWIRTHPTTFFKLCAKDVSPFGSRLRPRGRTLLWGPAVYWNESLSMR